MIEVTGRPYHGQRVLVTGAAGFIGRNMVRALHSAGAEVIAVVRPEGSRERPWNGSGIEALPIDLSHAGAVGAAVARLTPAIIFNLAGYGVDPTEREVALAERINRDLPLELATAASTTPDPSWSGRQLVHVGSALEYGVAAGALAEETVPLPTTLYGTTKLAGTRAVTGVVERTAVRALTARLFTVYGPGEHPMRLLPSLLRAAREEAPIPLTAGLQRRDFAHADDVVEGLLRLGLLTGEVPATVNLASGQLVTVREFTERAATVLGIPPTRLQFGSLPTRGEEMAHDPVSLARLDALCGWRPSLSIEEGVRRTVLARDSAAE